MALTLKIKNSIDVYGKILYIEDATGEYDEDTNEEGWGTPNEIRNENAVMCIIEKIVMEGDKLFASPISTQILYSNSFANDYISKFEFSMLADGGYIHYLIALPVSADGVITLAGVTITDGMYFYMEDGYVHQLQSSVDVIITDYSALVDVDNIYRPTNQSNCQQFWTPMLSIKEGELYKQYRESRSNCNSCEKIIDDVLELNLNITHANGLFYQGLQLEAEDVINTQLDYYGL